MTVATPKPIDSTTGLAPPGVIAIADLTELMRSVNQVTERLQSTHIQLQEQVTKLQHELAEANAQLRRSRTLAALGEMAAGIAHEVRNPLGSIQLYVQMLQEDLAAAPAHAELCGKIRRAVDGIEAIVRDVLLFAREARINPVRTTGEALIGRAMASCESLIEAAGVSVDLALSPQPLPLDADAGLVTQALANVIRNAVEAMAESACARRELRVIVARHARQGADGRRSSTAVFTVIDSGPGIDPAVLDRMFNPFFTTRPTGTGLGLAIVHRIIDAHGGQVVVSNDSGAGARVEIRLPLTQPQSAASPAAPRPRRRATAATRALAESPAFRHAATG